MNNDSLVFNLVEFMTATVFSFWPLQIQSLLLCHWENSNFLLCYTQRRERE